MRKLQARPRFRPLLLITIGVASGLALGLILSYFLPVCGYEKAKSPEATEDNHYARPTPEPQGYISLMTRKYVTEGDNHYEYQIQDLTLKKCALVLIDIWVSPPGSDWDLLYKEKILPLLTLARENGVLVVHAYHQGEPAEEAKPIEGEFVIDSMNGRSGTDEVDKYLQANGVETILYAGVATNMCILTRPEGIIKMNELGYNVILIRDCTLAVENDVSREGQWAKEMAVFMVELNWGTTTTLDDLRQALESRQERE